MPGKCILHIIFFIGIFISSGLAQSNEDYRNLKFHTNPRHQSEIGLSVGNFMVLGDILPEVSWGAGLHFRRAFDYAFSWRVDAMYGIAKGLEPRNSGGPESHTAANYVLNGTLNNGINFTANDWYHNYQTKFMSLTLQGVWNLNTFNFKKQERKTTLYLLGGFGMNSFKAYYDAKNSNGVQHDFGQVGINLDTEGSRADRNTARSRIKNILDGDFETRAEIAQGKRNNNDPEAFHINFHGNAGFGVSFKINERFNISIEQQMTFVFGSDANLIDGYRWRAPNALTQNNDIVSYTNIRFNINIGKKQERAEPLWWVSPLSLLAEDLAEVKARPAFDTTDSDNDGVIDMLDEEPDTPEGFPVDTKGKQLDSDGDGVADGNDEERYSPPGYSVDAEGIAQVPAPDNTNEDDVNRIVDAKISDYAKSSDVSNVASGWILYSIQFDLDSYKIKDSEVGILRSTAKIMKDFPNKRVAVIGHSDQSSNSCYSDFLSYNRAESAINYIVGEYAISRDRFILNWSGENDKLEDSGEESHWNSRAEFRIATSEYEQDRPNCLKNSGKEGVPPSLAVDTEEIAENDVDTEDFTWADDDGDGISDDIDVNPGFPDKDVPDVPDQVDLEVMDEDVMMSSKVLGIIITALLLIIIALLGLIIYLVLFYRRKEKQKAKEKEEKEKGIFPPAMVFLEEVKHIVGEGDTGVAIQKLLQYFNETEKLKDELIQISARYENYKSQQRKGLIDPSDTIILNRINNAIIELINESKDRLVIN